MGTRSFTLTITISSKLIQILRSCITSQRREQLKQLLQMACKFLNFQTSKLKSISQMGLKKSCKYIAVKFIIFMSKNRFPDGTIKCIFADGEEESIFTDGTIQRIEKNGVKAIEYASGQKDILYPDGTRVREYPDGRVKKTLPDGTTETSMRDQGDI